MSVRLAESVGVVRAAFVSALAAQAECSPREAPPREEVSVWCTTRPAVGAVERLAASYGVRAFLDGAVLPYRVRVCGRMDDLVEFLGALSALPVLPLSVSS